MVLEIQLYRRPVCIVVMIPTRPKTPSCASQLERSLLGQRNVVMQATGARSSFVNTCVRAGLMVSLVKNATNTRLRVDRAIVYIHNAAVKASVFDVIGTSRCDVHTYARVCRNFSRLLVGHGLFRFGRSRDDRLIQSISPDGRWLLISSKSEQTTTDNHIYAIYDMTPPPPSVGSLHIGSDHADGLSSSSSSLSTSQTNAFTNAECTERECDGHPQAKKPRYEREPEPETSTKLIV
jgi:hypothetical protein